MRQNIALNNHIFKKEAEIVQSIRIRRKVYLDINFWINMRNAAIEGTDNGPYRELYELLKRGVKGNRLVCPMSGAIFIEMLKQTYEPSRRIAMASLIDQLSLGISLAEIDVRIKREIARFYSYGVANDCQNSDELVWTKLSMTLGVLYPSHPTFDTAEFSVQAAFLDKIWDESLEGIVSIIGDKNLPRENDLSSAASRINLGIKANQASLISFEKTYQDEIRGVSEFFGDYLLELIKEKAESLNIQSGTAGRETRVMARNLLAEALLRKKETQKILRTMHLQAALHAALRWNKNKDLTANDLYDFQHACGALAYCDAFFTDGFLANLINGGNIRLGELNPCLTTSKVEEAVQIIRRWVA